MNFGDSMSISISKVLQLLQSTYGKCCCPLRKSFIAGTLSFPGVLRKVVH